LYYTTEKTGFKEAKTGITAKRYEQFVNITGTEYPVSLFRKTEKSVWTKKETVVILITAKRQIILK